MQLKEFSLFVPNVESGTVLKALETAIPSSAIEQASPNGQAPLGHRGYKSHGRAETSFTITFAGLFSYSDELMVKSNNLEQS